MSATMHGRSAFTLLELLIVVAIIGILAAVATPTYLGWRADALSAEAARTVQSAISGTRARAKRSGAEVSVVFADGATTVDGARPVALPNGGTLSVATGVETLTFVPPFGAQETFAPLEIGVVTGDGGSRRTATVTVVPPLGKTGVVR